ncbi:unnamed protein product [Clonostachys rosea]|uniref:Peptidase M20 dimerisation domain-containing protein n=1 Tax=Bionectria ochroleuca TaxID=29856 RepID=A0ABY6UW19_BIOOC|nr:unnamed protein product [Clonostachys rosea]
MGLNSSFMLSLIVSGLLPCIWGTHAAALESQRPLHASSLSRDDFKQDLSRACELTEPIWPKYDGFPTAEHLFDNRWAFKKQLMRHGAIVQVDSVCYDDLGDIGKDERWHSFDELHNRLRKLYPMMHNRRVVNVENVNTYGLVYTIQGRRDDLLKPILLTAHQDVVPVGNESEWTYEPFSAEFDGEWMWGRGVADDKNRLTAIMSVFEELLQMGWRPQRTFIFASGFDEECSGYRGAAKIGERLLNRYGKDGFEAVIDEGGLGMIELGGDGNEPVVYALPGVTEKGFVNVWFDLQVQGGHSSAPPPHTGIGIMSEIVVALEDNPYTPQLEDESPIYESAKCLARYSPNAFPDITHLVEQGDLENLTLAISSLGPEGMALLQTTQAVDVIYGGDKINSLPEAVTVGVNYRVATQNSVVEVQHNVVKYVMDIVDRFGLHLDAYAGDDEYHEYATSIGEDQFHNKGSGGFNYEGALTIRAEKKFDGAHVSRTDTDAWRIFAGTVEATFGRPGTTVVPTGVVMTGNTDSKHYLNLSKNIYRWNPHPAFDIQNFHAVDERLKMSAHIGVAKFYYNLIRNFDQAGRRFRSKLADQDQEL